MQKFLIFQSAIFSLLMACSDQPIENPEFYTVNSIGANGYDLVSYFENPAPIQGSPEYSANIDGVTYYFSSSENKKIFESSPGTYLPAYGGWCAYAMANDGSLMSSNPDKYEIQDGKLYLFFDNILTSIQGGLQKEWNSDPTAYRSKADENWDEHLKTIY